MIRSLAAMALLLASAPSLATQAKSASAKLSSSAPWWERVTVTIAGDGNTHSCKYETSLLPANSKDCDVEGDAQALGADAPSGKDQFTQLTFERRFSPGGAVVDRQRRRARRYLARPPGDGPGDRFRRRGQGLPGRR